MKTFLTISITFLITISLVAVGWKIMPPEKPLGDVCQTQTFQQQANSICQCPDQPIIYDVGNTNEIDLGAEDGTIKKVRVVGADAIILDNAGEQMEYQVDDIINSETPMEMVSPPISIDPINIKPIKVGGEKE